MTAASSTSDAGKASRAVLVAGVAIITITLKFMIPAFLHTTVDNESSRPKVIG